MVDYSKWKAIEISDDEDDTHPNIDTPSLFRWRHKARVERMEEMRQERMQFEERKTKFNEEYSETSKKLQTLKADGKQDKELEEKLAALEIEGEKLNKLDEELKKKEATMPWNVDTISQPGFSKTVVNVPKPRLEENLTEEEKDRRYKQFVKENESLIKKYGMLRKYDDSKQFLTEHPQLACEDTANYLVVWCINLEMDDKHELMLHVAHQTICMQYMMELSRQLQVDPKSCVSVFFSKIQLAEGDYKLQFDNEIKSFVERVSKRAQEKLDAILKEAEEEERAKRLGPGGLDPVEVMESLPEELQLCFETRDVKMLQDTIAKMDRKDAAYHMKRCVDSGLWVPDADKSSDEQS